MCRGRCQVNDTMPKKAQKLSVEQEFKVQNPMHEIGLAPDESASDEATASPKKGKRGLLGGLGGMLGGATNALSSTAGALTSAGSGVLNATTGAVGGGLHAARPCPRPRSRAYRLLPDPRTIR